MKPQKAVVVGGCGFLGSPVSERLLNLGIEVLSVHRSGPHGGERDGHCVSADYRDSESMARVLKDADILVHLGSQSVPRTSVALGVTGILGEVSANSELFETAAKLEVPRVVFASSGGSVYGVCEPVAPISEEHITRPISPHGLLKVMTELVLAHVAGASGQVAVSLRPGNIYGPGQRSQRLFGVVPTFINNLINGVPCEIWGPEVVRDYVFVDDAADAFVAAALTDRPMPRAINVGTGIGHTALEIYGLLQSELGVRLPISVAERPKSDPPWNVLATDTLRGRLDVTEPVDLEQGLRRTVEALADASAGGGVKR